MSSLYQTLAEQIHHWTRELGFQQVGISAADVSDQQQHFQNWIDKGYHGDMAWMVEHGEKRTQPQKLIPGTTRVISVRMNYLPPETEQIKILKSPSKAYVSRYALGRDYHKLIRKRLATIAQKIEDFCQSHDIPLPENQRAFVDSAPVLERPLAQQAGLGWVGKHTLLINKSAGSWFFLGEIYTNLPLPTNQHIPENACGDCQACLQVCPTDAFPKPYVLDATRCISYLTIENKGPIAEEFREVMGNRVFGCDDCQAICPWNKYADFTKEKDFHPRHHLDSAELVDLFNWNEQEFLDRTAGSAIRRIGYQNWLRNLAIGLGNAPASTEIVHALNRRIEANEEGWLQEHFLWALERQKQPPKRRKRKLKRN
ncbi:tRNA epoxyqueuosine(34) reductase QueG [Agarilytica rhodophyticola]|uniref:tRNA epoxyqueuosine(34) reductase QueG n=1 Tax=Agarilytica rhodophyticola TaxID=1737490 RepID=UPI000B343E08|nr:tRNA epoxyqueuosine(34) reductase QueG [Agarilytica rhodophyticola]